MAWQLSSASWLASHSTNAQNWSSMQPWRASIDTSSSLLLKALIACCKKGFTREFGGKSSNRALEENLSYLECQVFPCTSLCLLTELPMPWYSRQCSLELDLTCADAWKMNDEKGFVERNAWVQNSWWSAHRTRMNPLGPSRRFVTRDPRLQHFLPSLGYWRHGGVGVEYQDPCVILVYRIEILWICKSRRAALESMTYTVSFVIYDQIKLRPYLHGVKSWLYLHVLHDELERMLKADRLIWSTRKTSRNQSTVCKSGDSKNQTIRAAVRSD